MRRITIKTSRYKTHEGWAMVDQNGMVIPESIRTTRAQVREFNKGMQLDLLNL